MTARSPAGQADPARAGQVQAELAPYGPLPDGLGSRGLLPPDLEPVPPSFLGMIDALRVLQNQITGSAPGEDLTAEVSRALTDLAVRLGAHAVGEEGQIAGRIDVPGRAQALVPLVHLDEQDEQHAVGRVTFGRFYLGRNGAAHGGAIPLVFDEVMGRLSNTGRASAVPDRIPARQLPHYHADRAGASADRADRPGGRPQTVRVRGTARRRHLCADAEGLFIALRRASPDGASGVAVHGNAGPADRRGVRVDEERDHLGDRGRGDRPGGQVRRTSRSGWRACR